MEFKGGTLTGFKYGQLSPPDYTGLKVWSRASDGVTLNARGAVSAWKNLANPAFDWVTSSIIGFDALGYYLTGGSANGIRLPGYGTGYLNFLTNGSPFTVFVISNNANQAIQAWDASQYPNSAFGTLLSSGSADTAQAMRFRVLKDSSTTGRVIYYDTPFNTPLNNLTLIRNWTSYGYGSTAPQTYMAYNDVQLATGNYLNPPSTADNVGNTFRFVSVGSSRIREVIIYDHTGKPREQIDAEVQNLRELYIRKRYPSIY